MTSERQVEANRKNAQRSTGPITDEGKDRSRRNSLKNGLAGKGIVLPEDEARDVEGRARFWGCTFRPESRPADVFLHEMAVNSVLMERCQREMQVARVRRSDRADVSWDDDRRLDAERLFLKLAACPPVVSRQLSGKTHGVDALAQRWVALGTRLEAGEPWDDASRALALDMLGVPIDLRDVATAIDAPSGVDPITHQRSVVDQQLDRLDALRADYLDERDERARTDAVLGLEPLDDETRLLRRYEAACYRRMMAAMRKAEFDINAPLAAAPAPKAEAEAEAAPPPPKPPFAPSTPPVLDGTDHILAALDTLIARQASLPGSDFFATPTPEPVVASAPTPAPVSPTFLPSPTAKTGNRKARRAAARLLEKPRVTNKS